MRTPTMLLAFFCIQACLQASDWMQWRGPDRNCKVRSADAWPASLDVQHLTKKWSVPLGPGYSGPLVCSDLVIVTETRNESHEVVRALNRSTGDEVWRAEWPGATQVPFFAAANGSWIRSTPACDGERLYIAGILDVLVCLDLQTGKEIWRCDFVKKFNTERPAFGTVCSPLIDGDFVYLQAAASVVKIRKSDGGIVWRSNPESASGFGASMSTSAFSSPVIETVAGTRHLIVQSRQSLSGLDLETGKELWSVNVPAFRGMNILTPHIIGNSIFTSSYGGGSFLFDVKRSEEGLAVTERWQTKTQGYMSSPVTIDNHLYLHLRNQRFTCIDPKDGTSTWTTRPFGKYWSTVANGRRILALDQRGSLHLVDANPTEYKEMSSRKVSEAETWAHLCVVDSNIFIRELNAISVWQWE